MSLTTTINVVPVEDENTIHPKISSPEEWTRIEQSYRSGRTVNPLRKIADFAQVPTNKDKEPIQLFLGDPTLSGILPPPKVAVEALEDVVKKQMFNGYRQTFGDLSAREAVAKRYSCPEAPLTADDIILTSGCSHALQLSIDSLANLGDNILIPKPGFPLYATLCRSQGIELTYKLDMNSGLIDLNNLEKLIDKKTKAIVLNNPGNPTGVVLPKEHLEEILKIALKHRLPIIADEVYGDLVYGGATFHPLASLSPKVPILTCDGISKRWMVPGWRLGWIAVHNIFNALTDVKKGIISFSQTIMGPSTLNQGALPKILLETPEEYFEHNRTVISRNVNVICEVLEGVPGLRVLKPQGAMYMMVEVDETIYGEEQKFVEDLIKEESVVAFPGSAFLAPGWIRLVITYSENVMREATERIRDFCLRKLTN